MLEIGGPSVLTYEEMMRIYAEEAHLRKRVVLRVPVLSPRLSSLWVGLVTPLPLSLARPLVDSLENEVVVRDGTAAELLGPPDLSYREAVRLALGRIESRRVITSWAGAELGGRDPADPVPTDPDWAGGTVLADRRVAEIDASANAIYRTILAHRGWARLVLERVAVVDPGPRGQDRRRSRDATRSARSVRAASWRRP